MIPPDHPLPPNEIAKYSPSYDPDEAMDIARYVEAEARDERVEHVERVREDFVIGERFERWDVITNKGRWWVITNATNLYSQKHFPSLDYTLSFHVGLMMRVRSRNRRPTGEEPTPFDELVRRQEQANARHEAAIEPEEFQAIGMQLRECLITLVTTMRRRTTMPAPPEPPKAADFIRWFELLMNELCAGEENKQLRQYLKTSARETWQLVNWLTHDRDANEIGSSIALHACETLIGHSIQLIVRREAGGIQICPNCSSRDIRTHFDIEIEPHGAYYTTCGACRWSNHPHASTRQPSVET